MSSVAVFLLAYVVPIVLQAVGTFFEWKASRPGRTITVTGDLTSTPGKPQ